MRKQFIDCKSRQTAYRRCPWAAIVAAVSHGYLAFESMTDYRMWRGQR